MASTQTPSRKQAKDAKLNELTDPPPASQFGEPGEKLQIVKSFAGGNGILAGGVQFVGDATPSAFTTRALADADNGMVLVTTSAQTATVNAGMANGYGVAVKGQISFVAGSGVTINDLRSTGAANPWCALTQIAANTYDIVGSKA